jgi:UDP-glucose 4-epimerase
MRALVTGANGFVGRNLVPQLLESGKITVVSTDVTPPPNPTVSFRHLDVTDIESVREGLRDIDVVLHLATHQLVPSLSDPLLNARINIIGLLNILESARKRDVKKVIFTSASSIVGDVEYNPVDEKHPCHPKTPYAVSKLACEHYLQTYQKLFGIDFVIFRFFNIYGPHQLDGVVPSTYRKIVSQQEVEVYGDGRQTRDFVYVEDLGQIFLKAITGEVKNVTLNVGTGIGATITDLISIAEQLLNSKARIKFLPPRPGEIQNFVASTDLIKATLGSAPSTSMESGLRRTFDWLGKSHAP